MPKDKIIDPAKLPQNQDANTKEVNQPVQPASTASELKEEQQKMDALLKGKQSNGTSSKTGINEQQSDGSAGAFTEFIDNAGKE